MIKTLACTAAGTFLLAMIGAVIANHAAHTAEYVPGPTARASVAKANLNASPAADRAPSRPQLIGAALNLYHTDRLDLYVDAIDRMKRAGFNAVQIVTPMFQTNGASPRVGVKTGPGTGPSPEDLATLLSHAKRLGMTTMLMPQVNFTGPRGNEWRGKLQPEHWAPWWRSYTQTLDRFLDIAIQNNVDIFVVGCELLTTHKPEHEQRWRQLIAHCRDRFAGQLTYSTTWDTYHKVTFWDALDIIGVSGYWDLTTLAQDRDHPTPDELKRRWVEIKRRLLTFADAQGKPVLLTEVGYPSLPWALKDPWNYINSNNVAPDHDAQAAGYAAFIAAWSDTIATPGAPGAPGAPDATPGGGTPGDPRFRGVFFHKWDPYHQGGLDDSGYGIVGKPAYPLLTDWLHGQVPPVAPATDR